MNIHPIIKEAAVIFEQAGKQVYLVGGAVRDLLLDRPVVKDWDLATDARPEEVISLFHKRRQQNEKFKCFVIPTGIKHGTVTVHYKDLSMEVTTFRSESGYSDRRHPDRVEFGVSIEEDLSRRDFTMNAAAYKLPSGPLVDPFNGREDIKKGVIRCVGEPKERFSEDGLRAVRALRFSSQLNFSVDEEVLAAIPPCIPYTVMVATERIRDELHKIILSDKPSIALLLMEKTGLLKLFLPELNACRGVKQDRYKGCGFHRFDVLDHSLLACDFASREKMSREVRIAALLHDIGKPKTAHIDEEGVQTFYRHEKESVKLARKISHRFKFSNLLRDKISHLIEEHMFHYEDTWTDAAVRRFIIRVGEENLHDLFDLRRADTFALRAEEPPAGLLLPLVNRIEETLTKGRALTLKNLAVSGNDLKELGIPTGKYMGIILKELLEAVIDDPELNTKEKLLKIAGKLNERYN